MENQSVQRLVIKGANVEFAASCEHVRKNLLNGEFIKVLLGVGDDLEAVFERVGIVAMAGADAPVGGVGVGHTGYYGSGKTAALGYVIPYAKLEHDGLRYAVVRDRGWRSVWELVVGLLHDGFSVRLEVAEVKNANN